MEQVIFNIETLRTGIRLSTPILLASLGGALCMKTGVFNIALEGTMLIGTFFAVAGSFFGKNAALGILAAVASAVAFALIYGLFAISFRAHEIVIGFGFNMLAIGLTGWFLVPVFGGKGAFYDPTTPTLAKLNIPLFHELPVIGPVLSGHNVLAYTAWAAVVILYFFLYNTTLGLRLRATGENPQAVSTLGLNSVRYKYIAVVISGALCGLAGAYISLSNLAMFSEGMTAGRGFISVAAVLLSSGYIPIAALASIGFGLSESIAIQLQGLGLPTQFVEMTPYIATIIMLIPTGSRFRKWFIERKLERRKNRALGR